jgi:hypothetical protein
MTTIATMQAMACKLSISHRPASSLVVAAMLAGCSGSPDATQDSMPAVSNDAAPAVAAAAPERWVVQGPATTFVADFLYDCPVVVGNWRPGAVALARATDGTPIRVPAETAFERGIGPASVDLYNECTGVTPADSSGVDPEAAPIIEVDADGEVVSGYIVADNYYELYVNGTLVSVDNTPYTPFNSSIVRFRVNRPYTLAFKLVDWDEHLGLGMELFPQGPASDRMESGDPWFLGDAGLIVQLSDGTVTGDHWKAQSFSIAPLDSPDDIVERDGIHDTSAFGRINRDITRPSCATEAPDVTGNNRLFPELAYLPNDCYAVHYPIPDGWERADFDDSAWPQAFEYLDDEVSTPRGLPAYFRYTDLFDEASFIWTRSLVLDNLVIARLTVE